MQASNKARRDFSVGEIVNFIAIDIQRIHDVLPCLSRYWIYPIQVAIVLSLLWQLLGTEVETRSLGFGIGCACWFQIFQHLKRRLCFKFCFFHFSRSQYDGRFNNVDNLDTD